MFMAEMELFIRCFSSGDFKRPDLWPSDIKIGNMFAASGVWWGVGGSAKENWTREKLEWR